MQQRNPPPWIARELALIDRKLWARWNQRTARWEIRRKPDLWNPRLPIACERDRLLLVVQENDGGPRPLDRRAINTIRGMRRYAGRRDMPQLIRRAIIDAEQSRLRYLDSKRRTLSRDIAKDTVKLYRRLRRGHWGDVPIVPANLPRVPKSVRHFYDEYRR